MPRTAKDPSTVWRYRGRRVGTVRDGVFYIDRRVAGRRVKLSTGCATLAAANAEYERFELNPGAYVNRGGTRAFSGRRPRGLAAVRDPARVATLRDAHIERSYSITPAEYSALLVAQDHSCGICGTPAAALGGRLEVDHDHVTGAVRGLLCGPCNRGLGQLGDSPVLLRRAAEYLEAQLERAPSVPLTITIPSTPVHAVDAQP